MKKNKLISAVAAMCAIAAVTAGIAQGSSTGKSTSTSASAHASSSAPGGPGGRPGDGPGGHAVHSVSVVLDKDGTAFVTQTSDSGTVQSVDSGAGTVTIVEGTKSVSYKTLTLSIPADATVMRNGTTSALSAIVAGDRVSVSSSSDGTTVFASDSSFHPEGGAGKAGPGGPPPAQR